jgi:3-hydroxyisobutyrate dehydrogenase-like beta-hydroxyacid dehydrogenase
MSSISIIGTGSMASALAGRALAGGNAVEIVGRDWSRPRSWPPRSAAPLSG